MCSCRLSSARLQRAVGHITQDGHSWSTLGCICLCISIMSFGTLSYSNLTGVLDCCFYHLHKHRQKPFMQCFGYKKGLSLCAACLDQGAAFFVCMLNQIAVNCASIQSQVLTCACHLKQGPTLRWKCMRRAASSGLTTCHKP